VVFDGSRLSAWDGQQKAADDRIREVIEDGAPAIRFELRGGDPLVSSGQRSEVFWGGDSNPTLRNGDDYYFGWATKFAPDFPSPGTSTATSRDGHSMFVQWKGQGTGGSPIDMAARNDVFQIGYAPTIGDGDCSGWRAPLVRGGWNRFVIHVRFSSDPNVGQLDIWHQSPTEAVMTQKLAGCRVATLKSGIESYLKLGYYRASDEQRTGVIFHRGFRVGTSFSAVNPA
jgi:hypothetical protein